MRKPTALRAAGANGDPGDQAAGRSTAPASEDCREVVLNGRRYRLFPVDEDPGILAAQRPPSPAPALVLTARELQIAALIADGLVNKQVAVTLQISEWTVSTHLRRIYAKLGVDTRAAMVSRCAGVLSSASVSPPPGPR